MQRYLTEAIGTFFLVLVIGLSLHSAGALAPLAIGSGLMVLVYMGGHISGAHYNPAVTLAVRLRGKIDAADVAPYMISQVLGAVLAALAVRMMTEAAFAPAPGVGVAVSTVLMAEVLFTFLLALVILNVATDPRTEGNSYYGLAIGFTVGTGAFAVGGLSGGVFNPAVGLGPILVDGIVGGGSFTDLWYYLVGPFLGGALAALVYRIQGMRETDVA